MTFYMKQLRCFVAIDEKLPRRLIGDSFDSQEGADVANIQTTRIYDR
jgi:hypothetical protein